MVRFGVVAHLHAIKERFPPPWLGVSRQHISAFMADPGNPTLETMVRMAHVLGLTVNIELVPQPDADANPEPSVAEAEA